MKIFKQKQAAPEQLTGTEQLRRELRSRTRHRSLIQIAGDLNDEAQTRANRVTAAAMARRMAGDDARDAAVASIARTLVNGFSADVNREARNITETTLQNFVDGAELSASIKAQVAEHLHNGHLTYDSEGDRLKSTRAHEPATFTHPAQWVNPNRAIQEAREALHAAIAAASR